MEVELFIFLIRGDETACAETRKELYIKLKKIAIFGV